MEDAKMRVLRRRIEKFLFQKLFMRRIDRRKKSASVIYNYCEEIKEAEGLRTVCQRFRLSVIKAQRVVKNFLVIRRTQFEVLCRFWMLKEQKLKRKQEEEERAKAAKSKSKSKSQKKPKSNFLFVPDEIRNEILKRDIKKRRAEFASDHEGMLKKAEFERAKNLIAGREDRRDTPVQFHFLPPESHIIALIKEGQEKAAAHRKANR